MNDPLDKDMTPFLNFLAARDAVVEAAKALDAHRHERHPELELRTATLVDGHTYWSPSAMMIDAEPLAMLRDALAVLRKLEETP